MRFTVLAAIVEARRKLEYDLKGQQRKVVVNHLLNVLALSVTRNKCYNDLTHVTKSALIMCFAISLALF